MENKETLDSMSMGKIWSLARERKIEIKGKKKKELIKEIIAADMGKTVDPEAKPVVEEAKVKKEKVVMVEVTLADGTKAKVPAKDIAPSKKEKGDDEITIKSVDGREMEVSVGRDHWVGKTIVVPAEQEEEIKRLLKEGGFYFV